MINWRTPVRLKSDIGFNINIDSPLVALIPFVYTFVEFQSV